MSAIPVFACQLSTAITIGQDGENQTQDEPNHTQNEQTQNQDELDYFMDEETRRTLDEEIKRILAEGPDDIPEEEPRDNDPPELGSDTTHSLVIAWSDLSDVTLTPFQTNYITELEMTDTSLGAIHNIGVLSRQWNLVISDKPSREAILLHRFPHMTTFSMIMAESPATRECDIHLLRLKNSVTSNKDKWAIYDALEFDRSQKNVMEVYQLELPAFYCTIRAGRHSYQWGTVLQG